jgi:hypothetical protein
MNFFFFEKKKQRILKDGTHNLPVSTVFPPAYREQKYQDSLRWVDNKTPVFQIKSKANSSIFSQEEAFVNFLKLRNSPVEKEEDVRQVKK